MWTQALTTSSLEPNIRRCSSSVFATCGIRRGTLEKTLSFNKPTCPPTPTHRPTGYHLVAYAPKSQQNVKKKYETRPAAPKSSWPGKNGGACTTAYTSAKSMLHLLGLFSVDTPSKVPRTRWPVLRGLGMSWAECRRIDSQGRFFLGDGAVPVLPPFAGTPAFLSWAHATIARFYVYHSG